jgi:hypothetical protein
MVIAGPSDGIYDTKGKDQAVNPFDRTRLSAFRAVWTDQRLAECDRSQA